MKNLSLEQMEIEKRKLWLWEAAAPDQPALPLVVLPSGEDASEQLEAILSLVTQDIAEGHCRPFRLAAFLSEDWNRDYTPWPGTALFKKESPFSGEGPQTLAWMRDHLLPELKKKTRTAYGPQNTSILGYSLAGLFALWAFYESGLFGGVASCSASLWYEGWTKYAAGRAAPPHSRVYLSLGDTEEKARNPRMASVGEATRQTAEGLRADPDVAESVLEWNSGGHFNEVPRRMARGLAWLMKP